MKKLLKNIFKYIILSFIIPIAFVVGVIEVIKEEIKYGQY